MRLRPDRSALRRTLTIALAVGPLVAACSVHGVAVPECGRPPPERSVVVASAAGADDAQLPIAVECWRKVGGERVEVWFTEPAGDECWQLSRLDVRESADAVSITLLASPRAACAAEAGDAQRTQVDLQAPIEDRAVLDGSR